MRTEWSKCFRTSKNVRTGCVKAKSGNNNNAIDYLVRGLPNAGVFGRL